MSDFLEHLGLMLQKRCELFFGDTDRRHIAGIRHPGVEGVYCFPLPSTYEFDWIGPEKNGRYGSRYLECRAGEDGAKTYLRSADPDTVAGLFLDSPSPVMFKSGSDVFSSVQSYMHGFVGKKHVRVYDGLVSFIEGSDPPDGAATPFSEWHKGHGKVLSPEGMIPGYAAFFTACSEYLSGSSLVSVKRNPVTGSRKFLYDDGTKVVLSRSGSMRSESGIGGVRVDMSPDGSYRVSGNGPCGTFDPYGMRGEPGAPPRVVSGRSAASAVSGSVLERESAAGLSL